VGIVSLYSHLHRTGRLETPLTEVAAFAGRLVVRSLAASDKVATRTERTPTRLPRTVSALA
ncbi:MAG TPA: hypothetical protein VF230_06650, partial [Acidimicrobiales bacterium]